MHEIFKAVINLLKNGKYLLTKSSSSSIMSAINWSKSEFGGSNCSLQWHVFPYNNQTTHTEHIMYITANNRVYCYEWYRWHTHGTNATMQREIIMHYLTSRKHWANSTLELQINAMPKDGLIHPMVFTNFSVYVAFKKNLLRITKCLVTGYMFPLVTTCEV